MLGRKVLNVIIFIYDEELFFQGLNVADQFKKSGKVSHFNKNSTDLKHLLII